MHFLISLTCPHTFRRTSFSKRIKFKLLILCYDGIIEFDPNFFNVSFSHSQPQTNLTDSLCYEHDLFSFILFSSPKISSLIPSPWILTMLRSFVQVPASTWALSRLDNLQKSHLILWSPKTIGLYHSFNI